MPSECGKTHNCPAGLVASFPGCYIHIISEAWHSVCLYWNLGKESRKNVFLTICVYSNIGNCECQQIFFKSLKRENQMVEVDMEKANNPKEMFFELDL